MNIIKQNLLSKYGLYHDSRKLYSDIYNNYLNKHGLFQQPDEIIDTVLYLKSQNIKTFLNIGTFNGATFDFIVESIPSIETAITIDPIQHHLSFINHKCLYLNTTSKYFKYLSFDMVFIDGDHSYEACKQDYINVGQFAKFCVFHDIDDDFIQQDLGGGCTQFWKDIKDQSKHIEYITNNKPCKNMGIGILLSN